MKRDYQRSRRLKRFLCEFSPAEKQYLRPYVDANATTRQFEIGDGVAMGLCHKGILYRPSSFAVEDITFDFVMTENARRMFKKSPNYLAD